MLNTTKSALDHIYEDESYWLIKAKRDLSARDPLDALNDVEMLLAWASERWFEVIKDYCSEEEAERQLREARPLKITLAEAAGPFGPDDRED